MTAKVKERAFDPFFTTKKVGEGTGLGLSQIHGFAAQAGGRAEIASAEGEGTIISLILPSTDKPLSEGEDGAGPVELPAGLRVLLGAADAVAVVSAVMRSPPRGGRTPRRRPRPPGRSWWRSPALLLLLAGPGGSPSGSCTRRGR